MKLETLYMYISYFNPKFRSLLVLLFLFCALNNTHAQVTIGSSVAPIAGALLDLKQEGTTVKGLALPRVALESLNQLKMSGIAIEDIDNAYQNHAGVIVYNMTSNDIFCPGIYVWNGQIWYPLYPPTPSDITVTDADNNIYNAKWFSKDRCDPKAGRYWTTSNMYATKAGDGTALPPSPHSSTGVRLNPGYRNHTANTAIIISSRADLEAGENITYQEGLESTSLNTMSLSRLNFAKKFGLLYTRDQAVKVCPAGWHLPTDSDWLELMAALSENGEVPQLPLSTNDIAQKIRSESLWYKSLDQVAVLWGSGDDANVVRSGFNAYPSGDVEGYNDTDGTRAVNFSSDTYWWSASKSSGGNPSTWYMVLNDKSLYHVDWLASSYYFSVRCVR